MSTKGTSTLSVVLSVLFNGAVFLGLTAAFIVLRMRFKRIYQPKSLDLIIKINKDQKYLEPLPPGLLSWIPSLLLKPNNFIIQQAGLDGYFFLRYLKVFACVSLAALIVIFPILLPINATGGNGKKGLDQLSFSNVHDHKRFYAHALLSLFFYPGVLYIIYRELTYYTYLRECILALPKYAYKLSSRVVLFQSVPKQYLNETEFKKLFEGVKRIWKATADKKLEKKVEKRKKLAADLENTLNSVLTKAVKVKRKADAKGEVLEPADELIAYIPQNKRPTIKKYKFFGPKKDKIHSLKSEIAELNKEIADLKSESNTNKSTMNSIFVEFDNQYYAQIALQTVVHHKPLAMSQHYIGVEPENVIWINMRLLWYERLVRKTVAVAAIVALVIFWAIPVAFVGVISNVNYLTSKLHFLRFLNNLPDELMGLVTALLPSILLLVLMALLPMFIRLMGKVAGAPSELHVEYFTQQAYFAFQVIQVFLVTTILSSAASVVTQIINKPTLAMNLLSSNLPSASNFYVLYIVLQSFLIAGGVLLQISLLVLFYLLSFFLDKTARKKWNRYTSLSTNSWGTDFPPFTNLAVISLTYLIILPIMLLFTAAGFGILYFAYLYFLCYVNNNAAKDSRGIHYPRALFQTITGIYLGQICLLGLFVVAKAWGAVAIDAVALGITVFVHTNLNNAFDKMLSALPVDTMRALDGVSETPSFFASNSKRQLHVSETTQYIDGEPEKGENCEKSVYSDVPIYSETNLELQVKRFDSLASVPLLADGAETPVDAKDNAIKRFFKPNVYLSYHYCKQNLPEIYNHVEVNDLNEEENALAYRYPALYEDDPMIWIPRDSMGISDRMIKEFEGVIQVSNDGAEFVDGSIKCTGLPPDFKL